MKPPMFITHINEETPKWQLNRYIRMNRAVLRNEPDSVSHRLGLGVLLGWTGDVTGAKRELETVLSISNDDRHRELAEKHLKRLTDQQNG